MDESCMLKKKAGRIVGETIAQIFPDVNAPKAGRNRSQRVFKQRGPASDQRRD